MDKERKILVIPGWLFVMLWVLAYLMPLVVLHWSKPGAVFAGIVIPLVWLNTMPCTCMGGGNFGAAFLGMMQLISLLTWMVIGITRLF